MERSWLDRLSAEGFTQTSPFSATIAFLVGSTNAITVRRPPDLSDPTMAERHESTDSLPLRGGRLDSMMRPLSRYPKPCGTVIVKALFPDMTRHVFSPTGHDGVGSLASAEEPTWSEQHIASPAAGRRRGSTPPEASYPALPRAVQVRGPLGAIIWVTNGHQMMHSLQYDLT